MADINENASEALGSVPNAGSDSGNTGFSSRIVGAFNSANTALSTMVSKLRESARLTSQIKKDSDSIARNLGGGAGHGGGGSFNNGGVGSAGNLGLGLAPVSTPAGSPGSNRLGLGSFNGSPSAPPLGESARRVERMDQIAQGAATARTVAQVALVIPAAIAGGLSGILDPSRVLTYNRATFTGMQSSGSNDVAGFRSSVLATTRFSGMDSNDGMRSAATFGSLGYDVTRGPGRNLLSSAGSMSMLTGSDPVQTSAAVGSAATSASLGSRVAGMLNVRLLNRDGTARDPGALFEELYKKTGAAGIKQNTVAAQLTPGMSLARTLHSVYQDQPEMEDQARSYFMARAKTGAPLPLNDPAAMKKLYDGGVLGAELSTRANKGSEANVLTNSASSYSSGMIGVNNAATNVTNALAGTDATKSLAQVKGAADAFAGTAPGKGGLAAATVALQAFKSALEVAAIASLRAGGAGGAGAAVGAVGKIASKVGVAGGAVAVGMGANAVLNHFSKSSVVGKGSILGGILKLGADAGSGALAGSTIGPWGTAIGAIAGAGYGVYDLMHGGAAPSGGGGGGNDVAEIIAAATKSGIPFTPPTKGQTTGGGHAAGSYHYKGEAVDFSSSPANMNKLAAYFATNYGSRLKELIHSPGYFIKDGKSVSGSFYGSAIVSEHYNHVHVAATPGFSGGGASGGGGSGVAGLGALAKSLTGRPYRSGGSGPAGWDCSGFTQYVFKQYGVSLPRTSQEQYRMGTTVSYGEAQSGDLLFFHYSKMPGASPNHVAIYIGNGMMVGAQSEKVGTVTTRVDTKALVGVKRVLGGKVGQANKGVAAKTSNVLQAGSSSSVNALGGGGFANSISGSTYSAYSLQSALEAGGGGGSGSAHYAGGSSGAGAGAAAGTAGASTGGSNNAQRAFNYLLGQGFSRSGAAGVVGNLMTESGVQPDGPRGDGGIARGIAQWHPDRWSNLAKYAAGRHLSPTSLDAQLGFLTEEMKTGTGGSVYASMRSATDVGAATRLFDTRFERSSGASASARLNNANSVLKSYSKGSWRTDDEVAQIHRNEMILPAAVAQQVRDAAQHAYAGQGGASANVTIHVHLPSASAAEGKRFGMQVKAALAGERSFESIGSS